MLPSSLDMVVLIAQIDAADKTVHNVHNIVAHFAPKFLPLRKGKCQTLQAISTIIIYVNSISCTSCPEIQGICSL